MEKVNEFIVATATAIVSMGAFIVKKLWSRIEKLESQVGIIEKNLLTKDDLEQLKDTQNLILQSLLEHRGTEKKDVH